MSLDQLEYSENNKYGVGSFDGLYLPTLMMYSLSFDPDQVSSELGEISYDKYSNTLKPSDRIQIVLSPKIGRLVFSRDNLKIKTEINKFFQDHILPLIIQDPRFLSQLEMVNIRHEYEDGRFSKNTPFLKNRKPRKVTVVFNVVGADGAIQIGDYTDPKSRLPDEYYQKLPSIIVDLQDSQIHIVDPVLRLKIFDHHSMDYLENLQVGSSMKQILESIRKGDSNRMLTDDDILVEVMINITEKISAIDIDFVISPILLRMQNEKSEYLELNSYKLLVLETLVEGVFNKIDMAAGVYPWSDENSNLSAWSQNVKFLFVQWLMFAANYYNINRNKVSEIFDKGNILMEKSYENFKAILDFLASNLDEEKFLKLSFTEEDGEINKLKKENARVGMLVNCLLGDGATPGSIINHLNKKGLFKEIVDIYDGMDFGNTIFHIMYNELYNSLDIDRVLPLDKFDLFTFNINKGSFTTSFLREEKNASSRLALNQMGSRLNYLPRKKDKSSQFYENLSFCVLGIVDQDVLDLKEVYDFVLNSFFSASVVRSPRAYKYLSYIQGGAYSGARVNGTGNIKTREQHEAMFGLASQAISDVCSDKNIVDTNWYKILERVVINWNNNHLSEPENMATNFVDLVNKMIKIY